MAREKRDAEIDFYCGDGCGEGWSVRGRFNAVGEFEAYDGDDLSCPECGGPGEPEGSDIEVAEA